jgi:hypothetical protein
MKKEAQQTLADAAAARTYAVKVLVGETDVRMRNQLDKFDWLVDFCLRPGTDLQVLNGALLERTRGELLAFLGYHAISNTEVAELTPTAICGLRDEAAKGIEKYLSHGWKLTTSPTIWRGSDGKTQTIRGDTLATAFLETAHFLVGREGERLAHCPGPGCGRLFAKRKRGLYCSTKCAVAARTQRLNAKLEK